VAAHHPRRPGPNREHRSPQPASIGFPIAWRLPGPAWGQLEIPILK
jgi:hypothetical protein